jgi:hypothetical protein
MGRAHVDLLPGFRMDPAAKDATAWKSKSMHAIITDHGQFNLAVKWRYRYCLPLHAGNYGFATHSASLI